MNERMGSNTLKYLVIVCAWILFAYAIANVMGCASRRTGDMGDEMGLAIGEHMKKDLP